jgi:hypothetical protein
MPSCPTLPTSRQLAEELDVASGELCTPDRLPSLLEAVRAVPDPRTAHLVTHSWPMLLGLAACATLCGIRSVRGVIRWARGQGAGILAVLDVPGGDADRLPAATTLTRALARVDGDALDTATARSSRRTRPTHWPVSPAIRPCCNWPRTARRYAAPATKPAFSYTCSASTRSIPA